MYPRFHHVPELSVHTHGDLSRGWVSDAPLASCPCPSGWSHDLAAPVHDVQSRVYGPTACRLTLSLYAPRHGSQRPVGDVWGPECGALCSALAYFPDGPLSPGVCLGPPGAGHGAHPVWARSPWLFPG